MISRPFLPLLGVFALSSVYADVTLPSILSAHAVLQKSTATRIWGKADPGEVVHVSLGEIKGEATANTAGKWETQIDLGKSLPGPFDLVVEGKNRIVVTDVVVGEVWLCSGQSNMQYSLKGDLSAGVEMRQTNPLLRQFKVTIASALEPKDDCEGTWTSFTPDTAAGFTGVGYYFGKKLQTELNIPVGLMHASVPGIAIEPCMSLGAFARRPALDAGRAKRLATFTEFPDKLKAYATAYDAWAAKYGREDKVADPAKFAAVGLATDSWKTITFPGKVATAGFPASGAIWVRHTLTAPHIAANYPATITLGVVHDFISIYWNGVEIAKTTPANPPALGIYKFSVPPALMKEGENLVAMRLSSSADQMALDNIPACGIGGVGQAVKLDGPWVATVENTLPPLPPGALAAMPRPPGVPNPAVGCSTYNAMIAPLVPDTIRGIIWYQGESNVSRPQDYIAAFPAMIEDFREKWGTELPFYFCQLPNFLPPVNDPSKGGWADQREAQTSALKLPKTGMAVLIDVGEEANLHPRNKKDPGERLARLALAQEYGKSIPFSGPVYDSMTAEGDKITIKFRELNGGLVAKPLPATYQPNTVDKATKPLVRLSPNSELEGFMICGEDHKWTPADAKIDGERVVVSAAGVSKPVAVRYLWDDSPIGNFYNAAGLPAAPFRTDSFELKQQTFHY